MKDVDGNLRPLSVLSRTKKKMLPSARIHCASGRIQVGDRTYLSASDALSAYLRQFDGKQQAPSGRGPPPPVSAQPSSPFAAGSMDTLVQSTRSDPLSRTMTSLSYNPSGASVTGLLTGSPRGQELTGTTLNGPTPCALQTGAVTAPGSTDVLLAGRSDNSSTDIYGQAATNANCFYGNRQQIAGSNAGTELGVGNGLRGSELSEAAVPRARSEIETLMCTQASRRQMAQEAQDTLREVKLKRLMEENNNRSQGGEEPKSSLQKEVEEALTRSAQLLETIQTDTLVSPRCVSDVGSLNTDMLLSINPYNPEALPGRQSRSRHRYSYHTPGHQHTRSLSLGRVPSSEMWQPSLKESGRRRSVDSLGPMVMRDKVPQEVHSSTASSVSAVSDPSDILKHFHNLSASSHIAPGQTWSSALPHHTGGPPSWIQELIPAAPDGARIASKDLMDSIFSERDITGGRAPPSWVNGIDQSEVASSVDTQDLRDTAEVLAVTGMKALTVNGVASVDDSVNTADFSCAGPGLNYSDLMASPAPNKLKVSFRNPLKPSAVEFRSKIPERSRNDVLKSGGNVKSSRKPPTGRIHQDLAGVDVVQHTTHNLSRTLSSSLGAADSSSRLRKKICEDSVEARHSLEKYLSRLGDGDGGDAGAVLAGIPRCSSLETLNLTGQRVKVPSDVTGASSITKGSNFSSKLCLDDPTLTPAKAAKASELVKGKVASPELDDLLEGDRPWENPSFKSPVPVGNSSPGKHMASNGARPATPTLSGGQQPGSMEALKQMLFRLQTEETSGKMDHTASGVPLENGGASSLIPALADYDFKDEPGGQSLERALVHLGRLKTLVQTTGPNSKVDAEQDTAN